MEYGVVGGLIEFAVAGGFGYPDVLEASVWQNFPFDHADDIGVIDAGGDAEVFG